MIYLVGALKNPKIPEIAIKLRELGFDVFDQWHCPGPDADMFWQEYAKRRGWTYKEALADCHAEHVFLFDKKFLEKADTVILVMPCGRSGHLELGWSLGQGKKGYVLFEGEPERYDVMYRFTDGVFTELDELVKVLKSG